LGIAELLHAAAGGSEERSSQNAGVKVPMLVGVPKSRVSDFLSDPGVPFPVSFDPGI